MPIKRTPMEGAWEQDSDVETIIKYRTGDTERVGEAHWRGRWTVVWDGIPYETAQRILYEVGAQPALDSGTFLWTPRTRQPGDSQAIDIDNDGIAEIVLEEIEIKCRLAGPQPSTTPIYRTVNGQKVARLELQIESARTFPERAGFGFPETINFALQAESGDDLDFSLLTSQGSESPKIAQVVVSDANGQTVDVLDFPSGLPYTFASAGQYSISIVSADDFSGIETAAFDSEAGVDASSLDLSDVTDLTTVKVIARLGSDGTYRWSSATQPSWLPDTVTTVQAAAPKNATPKPVDIGSVGDQVERYERAVPQALESGYTGNIGELAASTRFAEFDRNRGGGISGDTQTVGLGSAGNLEEIRFIFSDGFFLNTEQLKAESNLVVIDGEPAILQGRLEVLLNNCPALTDVGRIDDLEGDLRASALSLSAPLSVEDINSIRRSVLSFAPDDASYFTNLTRFEAPHVYETDSSTDKNLWGGTGTAGTEPNGNNPYDGPTNSGDLNDFVDALYAERANLPSSLTINIDEGVVDETGVPTYDSTKNSNLGDNVLVATTLTQDSVDQIKGQGSYSGDGLLDYITAITHNVL